MSEIHNIGKFEQYLKFGEDNCYIMVGMQRSKDNNGIGAAKQSSEGRYPQFVKRYIINNKVDYWTYAQKLIAHGKMHWQSFRIYITHNPRSLKKAYANLHVELFRKMHENDSVYIERLGSLPTWFKTYLHRPTGKAFTAYHMLDIDNVKYPELPVEINVVDIFKTKNGFHTICEPFNPKLVQGIADVSFKQDAMIQIYSN